MEKQELKANNLNKNMEVVGDSPILRDPEEFMYIGNDMYRDRIKNYNVSKEEYLRLTTPDTTAAETPEEVAVTNIDETKYMLSAEEVKQIMQQDRPSDLEIAEVEEVGEDIPLKNRKNSLGIDKKFNILKFLRESEKVEIIESNIEKDTDNISYIPLELVIIESCSIYKAKLYARATTGNPFDYLICRELIPYTYTNDKYGERYYRQVVATDLLQAVFEVDREQAIKCAETLITTNYQKAEIMQMPLIELPDNDYDRGMLVIKHTETEYLYNSQHGELTYFNGKQWIADLENSNLYEHARQLSDEIKNLTVGTQQEKAGRKCSNELKNISTLNSMANRLHSVFPVLEDAFDKDKTKNLLNTSIGTYNLSTLIMQEHNKNDYIKKITKGTPIANFKVEDCPIYKALCESMQQDPQMIKSMVTVIGYLVADVEHDKMIINVGKGGDGKSTFYNALANCLGDYATTIQSGLLLKKQKTTASEINPELARIKGKKLCLAMEIEDSARLGKDDFKRITGQDKNVAYLKYSNIPVEFVYHGSIAFLVNSVPKFDGLDNASTRRLIFVPWEKSHTESGTQNKELKEQLFNDVDNNISFILWCLEQFKLNGNQIYECPKMLEFKAKEFYKNNTIARFVDDCLIQTTTKKDYISKTDMFKIYQAWCKAENVQDIHVGNSTTFHEKMNKYGYTTERTNKGQCYQFKRGSNVEFDMADGRFYIK